VAEQTLTGRFSVRCQWILNSARQNYFLSSFAPYVFLFAPLREKAFHAKTQSQNLSRKGLSAES
jgi:hypothetical protein